MLGLIDRLSRPLLRVLDPEDAHTLTIKALKRMPRGFADDHPAGKWLRYQSFTSGRMLTDAQVTNGRLPALLEKEFAGLLPLVRWLNTALGYPAV